jgi:hypothetical protein
MADSLAQLLAGLDLNKEGALALVLEAARRSDEAVREAQAAVRKARQGEFLANMRAISSSSSVDTASCADERRGAPAPTCIATDAFFVRAGYGDEVAAASDAAVTGAWRRFREGVSAAKWPARGTVAKVDENKHMHPLFALLLAAVLEDQGTLRLVRNEVTPDEVAVAQMQPDFSVVHARDTMPTLLGAVFMLEVKLPGNQAGAERQAHAYARRRVYPLLLEALNRGEAGDAVSTVVAGSDGRLVTLSLVMSGAPPLDGEWAERVPCPVVCTQQLELLPGWDGALQPDLPDAPPVGFVALARLLCDPQSPLQRAGGVGLPLRALRVRWDDGAPPNVDVGAAAGVEVSLGVRLGLGGTSDVYAVPVDGSVVKIGRCATASLELAYTREVCVLTAMSRSAHAGECFPRLLRVGTRVVDVARTTTPVAKWRVLQLQPLGEPLQLWLAREAGAAMTAATEAGDGLAAALLAQQEWLRTTATAIASRVLDALQCAHAEDFVHCDVRPSNVVMAAGGAVLVDWGASRSVGSEGSGVGVPAFADAGVFAQATYAARPAQDVVPTALLWLAVAVGCGRAPWALSHGDDAETLEARRAWLEGAQRDASLSEHVRRVAGFALDYAGANRAAPLLEAARALLVPQPAAA